MELTELLGYFSAIIIGFTLGLIGGGGSILTVPVLVYLMGLTSVISTAYSLFIVGATSLVGSVQYMRKGLVSYRTALVFAVPSFTAVFLTRKYVVPAIPDPIFTLSGFTLTKDMGLLLFFALIMLASSFSMIRSGKKKENSPDQAVQQAQPQRFNYPMIVLEGLLVGGLTGLVGAGGGFLIIPALVLLARLPMKMAVGTSLLIIAAKSLIGFLGDVAEQQIDWSFLLLFTALSIVGIFLGSYASRFIPGARLKAGFGWFVLIMGIYIVLKELVL